MSHLYSRRTLLQQVAAAAGTLAAPAVLVPRMSFAAAATGDARLVLVLLRGALDGLAAAPPVGDPHYTSARGEMALSPADGIIPLDDLFALHPALSFMGAQWQQRQLALLHAVATPYRERSHFDAQDVLESGHARPHAAQSGWLNRALGGLPRAADMPLPRQPGVALASGVPLVMRGPSEVASWAPSRLRQVTDDTLERLADLYAGDALLSRRLADAAAAQALAGEGAMDGAGGRAGGLAQLAQAASTAAGFLLRADGPRVAVLETTGWDTHANQGQTQGVLATRLAALDAGLRTLHDELGTAWQHTAVLVVTEFGRTVAFNGTRGTDHGTGSAAFLLGGAVRGQVVSDWPGLSPGALHEQRDLAPTLDLRDIQAALLHQHLGIEEGFITREVFPGHAVRRGLPDLVSG
ncbi:MAG TPA: DUF1501 domain-containing protein [Steroidobacteraceae bacterium]|nr:DUF1501 domain-containing protein [Steroidobacteraceae bacterium]